MPDWTYEDPESGTWDTSTLVNEHNPKQNRDSFLQEIVSDPNKLRAAAEALEQRGDPAGAAELREHLKSELERRFTVGNDTLVFRRVLEAKDKNNWQVIAGGRRYVCEDPENFSLDYAKRKADAEDRNEDGIPGGEIYRFLRKVQGGLLSLRNAPGVYINLSLIANGRAALLPFELDDFVTDVRNRALCDSAVLHSYEAAHGQLSPAFRQHLEKLGQPLTLALLQQQHEVFTLTQQLQPVGGEIKEPPRRKFHSPLHNSRPSTLGG